MSLYTIYPMELGSAAFTRRWDDTVFNFDKCHNTQSDIFNNRTAWRTRIFNFLKMILGRIIGPVSRACVLPKQPSQDWRWSLNNNKAPAGIIYWLAACEMDCMSLIHLRIQSNCMLCATEIDHIQPKIQLVYCFSCTYASSRRWDAIRHF